MRCLADRGLRFIPFLCPCAYSCMVQVDRKTQLSSTARVAGGRGGGGGLGGVALGGAALGGAAGGAP